MGYERFLSSNKAAEHFLVGCLKVSTIEGRDGTMWGTDRILKQIRDAEILAENGSRENTFTSEEQRSGAFRSKADRERLRAQIVRELLEMERIDDDDAIGLGSGGAKPRTSPRIDKQAYLLTGLPASGKSSVVSKIADSFGAYVIDPDFAKRKLPEYDDTVMGAALVHAESSAITIGKEYPGPNLLQACLHKGFNIVRPMVGERREKIDDFRKFLTDHGYKVHLSVIDIDREVAVKRALKRFIQTGRYVSLSYVFDDCGNDPPLVYYRYRAEACDTNISPWESLGAVSTSGAMPIRLDSWGKGNPAELFV